MIFELENHPQLAAWRRPTFLVQGHLAQVLYTRPLQLKLYVFLLFAVQNTQSLLAQHGRFPSLKRVELLLSWPLLQVQHLRVHACVRMRRNLPEEPT
jgi:hypothetical protein